jgi:hypothetical protein
MTHKNIKISQDPLSRMFKLTFPSQKVLIAAKYEILTNVAAKNSFSKA